MLSYVWLLVLLEVKKLLAYCVWHVWPRTTVPRTELLDKF